MEVETFSGFTPVAGNGVVLAAPEARPTSPEGTYSALSVLPSSNSDRIFRIESYSEAMSVSVSDVLSRGIGGAEAVGRFPRVNCMFCPLLSAGRICGRIVPVEPGTFCAPVIVDDRVGVNDPPEARATRPPVFRNISASLAMFIRVSMVWSSGGGGAFASGSFAALGAGIRPREDDMALPPKARPTRPPELKQPPLSVEDVEVDDPPMLPPRPVESCDSQASISYGYCCWFCHSSY